jgi:hypothetical protein
MASKITSLNEMQKSFLRWSFNRSCGFLQASTGSGKSAAVMVLYLLFREKLSFKRLLIVTSSKAMEVMNDANIKNLSMVKIRKSEDLAIFHQYQKWEADVYLISNNMINKILTKGSRDQKKSFTELLNGTNLLCCDEIHNFRNYSNTSSKCFKKVTDFYQTLIKKNPLMHRILGVSATVVTKSIENYYSLFSYIAPEVFGPSYLSFQNRYLDVEQRVTQGGRRIFTPNGARTVGGSVAFTTIKGYKNLDELQEKVKPFIFTYNDDSFHFEYNLVYYTLNSEEAVRYNEILKGLGIDKQYVVHLQGKGVSKELYLDSTDTLFTKQGTVRVSALQTGSVVLLEDTPYQVQSCKEQDKESSYALRLLRAIQLEGVSEDRLKKIGDLVRKYASEGVSDGILMRCNFYSNLDAVSEYLHKEFPRRRIVEITGKTRDFQAAVDSIRQSDIVLATRVINDSFSVRLKHLVFVDLEPSPGKVQQAVGRLTRYDSPHRALTCDFLMRDLSVQSYLYEYLRLRLSSVDNKGYLCNLPKSRALEGIDDSRIDIDFLKKHLLWRRTPVQKGLF